MKLTYLYSLVALGGAALLAPNAANAQETIVSESVSVTEFTCDNTNHYYQNWRNNWFIQIGAGVDQPFMERGMGAKSDLKTVDKTKMTAVYNFGFGRWFSPYLGVRINALGGALHWDNPTLEQPRNGWSKAKHVNLNVELMWDMFNSLGGVNANRVFSIVPFVGLGGDYTWDIRDHRGWCAAGSNILKDNYRDLKNSSWTLPVTAGLQFRVRLCKYVDFFAEARASFYGDNWNDCAYGDPIEVNVACLGGLSFNIGGRSWETYNACDYLGQIAELNNQVNALRAQNLADAQAIAALQAQLPCPEPKKVVQKDCVNAPLMSCVRFKLDSDVITPEEEVNVYNMAQWLKSNPSEKIIIVGYADRDTGTSAYNMALSERRANAVANQLVNNYGIDRNRLTVRFDGSDVQPYSTNDWNRIVIFKQ